MSKEEKDKLIAEIRAMREVAFRRHGPGTDSAVLIRQMRNERTRQLAGISLGGGKLRPQVFKERVMAQDRISGAAADKYGRETAEKIAHRLGAGKIRKESNECEFEGEPIVIKCARKRTKGVGVTYGMLNKVKRVLAAFEADDGFYEVFSMDSRKFQSLMTETRSKGPSAGKVGIVTKRVFQTSGRFIRRIFV